MILPPGLHRALPPATPRSWLTTVLLLRTCVSAKKLAPAVVDVDDGEVDAAHVGGACHLSPSAHSSSASRLLRLRLRLRLLLHQKELALELLVLRGRGRGGGGGGRRGGVPSVVHGVGGEAGRDGRTLRGE